MIAGAEREVFNSAAISVDQFRPESNSTVGDHGHPAQSRNVPLSEPTHSDVSDDRCF
jgi:hypothetical protein